jgi:riboflavin synthase
VFTGLVEAVGRVRSWEKRPEGGKLTVEAPFEELVLGESISVSGACLTVTKIHRSMPGRFWGFEADVSAETQRLTTVGALRSGSRVNLERATQAHGRLGGHIVLGHVDATGKVERRHSVGDAVEVAFRLSKDLAPFVATKGSIAIEGVSLTLNSVTDDGAGVVVTVMLVPHTLGATTLDALSVGDSVNVEVDVLARYVARQLALVDGAARPYREGHDSERPASSDDERLASAHPRAVSRSHTESRSIRRSSNGSTKGSIAFAKARWSSSSTTRIAKTKAISAWPQRR